MPPTNPTEGKYTFGTTMGSPVSVLATYLVMEDVENSGVSTCEFQPPSGYVADTLTALLRSLILRFHRHLNSIELTIRFIIKRN